VEINHNDYKSQDYELEKMIFYHNIALQPSSVSKPSPNTIVDLIGE